MTRVLPDAADGGGDGVPGGGRDIAQSITAPEHVIFVLM